MEAGQQKIKKRIQKDIRYSALTTMTLRLVKKYKIYQSCKHLENKRSIKKRKNFSIIVMRLCTLTRHIMRQQGLIKQKAVDKMYAYLIDNIQKVLKEKYFDPKQQNQQKLLELALETSLRDIQVLKDALLTNSEYVDRLFQIGQGNKNQKQFQVGEKQQQSLFQVLQL